MDEERPPSGEIRSEVYTFGSVKGRLLVEGRIMALCFPVRCVLSQRKTYRMSHCACGHGTPLFG